MASILLTRPRAQSAALAEILSAEGWACLIAPMLEFQPLAAPPNLDARVAAAGALAFTSANGARAFAAINNNRDLQVFAVGDATAAAAREAGFQDVTSADGDAEALARLIQSAPPKRGVLHIRGAHGRGDLTGRLDAAGVAAAEAVLYEMQAATRLSAGVSDALETGGVEAAAFYSPRTAKIFASLASKAGLAPLSNLRAAAISPAAAAPLADLGLRRIDIAERPDATAMLRAVGRPNSEFS